jgi:hypothetical protein
MAKKVKLSDGFEETEGLEEVETTESEATEEVVNSPVKADEKTTYIMKVTHLSWGLNGRSHFYTESKPLINEKVMGNYADVLKIWVENGWIEKGKY